MRLKAWVLLGFISSTISGTAAGSVPKLTIAPDGTESTGFNFASK
jgi:hypothetical protein